MPDKKTGRHRLHFFLFLERVDGIYTAGSELDHLSLALLVAADLEVLAALDGQLLAVLALGALHAQHNLLGRLGLFPEDWLGLATVSPLLTVVTALALGVERILALLVLGHFVQGVLLALPLAKSPPLFRHVHLAPHTRAHGKKNGKTKTISTRHRQRASINFSESDTCG